jgi:hypothetical protein
MTVEGSRQLVSTKWYSLVAGIIGFTSYWSFFIYWAVTTKNGLGGIYYTIVPVNVLFSETILSIYDKKKKFFGPTGLGIILAWFIEVIFTSLNPDISPASHQLLPLEPIFFIFMIVPTSFIGSVFGRIISKFLVRRINPANSRRLINWLFVTAFILAIASPIMHPLVKAIKEYRAKAAIIEITHAQFSYYHDHPDEGFTCTLSKLMGGKSDIKNNQHGTYEVQYKLGYAYRLWCYPNTKPRNAFFLEVSPYSVTTSGDIAYCSDESGLVRSAFRRDERNWTRHCRESNNIIPTIMSSGRQ